MASQELKELKAALKFCFTYAGSNLAPFAAVGEGPQLEWYKCFGCDMYFMSEWPRWPKPADKDHEKDCKYLKAKRFYRMITDEDEQEN